MREHNNRGGRRLGSNEGPGWMEKVGIWLQDKRHRRIVIVVAAVLAALLCVAAAVASFVRPPDIPVPVVTPNPSGSEAVDEGDAPNIAASGRKDQYYTFLVCGRDTAGGGNTDTIMLVAYDVKNQKANVMNIPRDTMVNVSWDIKRINSVYNVMGLEGMKEHVGKLTGIVPDFYVIVEWEAVGELVNAIGGVTFEVPFDMDYDDAAQDLHIHQKAGLRRLTGEDAMQVVRWRKNNTGPSLGDIQRVQIQQDFLMAVAKECLQLSNLGRINEFARIFGENVDTDLTFGNLVWFGTQAFSMNVEEDLAFHTMPGNTAFQFYSFTYHNMQSYVLPDVQGILELVNEGFNPYLRDVQQSDLQVMVEKADGTLGVTSGTLADPRVGRPISRPTPSPTPTSTPTPTPTPTPTSTPEVTAQPSPSPEVTTQPSPSPEVTAEPTPVPESTPEPTPEPLPAETSSGSQTTGQEAATPADAA